MRPVGRVEFQRPGDRGQDGGDFLGQRLLDLLVGHFLAEAGAAEGGDHLAGDLGAQIGGDQQFLQFLQRLVIQPALLENGGDAAGELLGAARQALFQPGEETAERHQAASASRVVVGCAGDAGAQQPARGGRLGQPDRREMFGMAGLVGLRQQRDGLPTWAAKNCWPRPRRPRAARRRVALRTGLGTEGMRAAGVPGRSL